jgi:hypothetical protein
MSDTPVISPEQDKTPPSYATEPPRNVDYVDLPPGITLKPGVIAPKRPIFVVSVVVMVLTSLILFYIPFFSGLLAGALGGFHAGRMRRALAAAVVCSVMVPALLAFANFISEQPALRFLSGLSFWGWTALHVAGTFIGAVGGAASRPLTTERDIYQHA